MKAERSKHEMAEREVNTRWRRDKQMEKTKRRGKMETLRHKQVKGGEALRKTAE